MKKASLILAIAGSSLILASCAAGVTHNTPSGKVEVTVLTQNMDAVKGWLINSMTNEGYSITQDSSYRLVFDKPSDDFMANVFFGSSYDSTPNLRISYSFSQIRSLVRVVADFAIITNPGSGFERRTDMNNNKTTLRFQQKLNTMRADIEAAHPIPLDE